MTQSLIFPTNGIVSHSYDHRIANGNGNGAGRLLRWRNRGQHHDHRQLLLCRDVDHRVKGYRPPQSRLSPGLCDANLSHFNYEWLATSAYSLGFAQPRAENGIVKIPIAFDDYDLHRGVIDYPEWEQRALRHIDENEFVAFGLHDCYASHWLPHYEGFLERIREHARLATLDEVAAEVMRSEARWVQT